VLHEKEYESDVSAGEEEKRTEDPVSYESDVRAGEEEKRTEKNQIQFPTRAILHDTMVVERTCTWTDESHLKASHEHESDFA
jgi:hypothetical protein